MDAVIFCSLLFQLWKIFNYGNCCSSLTLEKEDIFLGSVIDDDVSQVMLLVTEKGVQLIRDIPEEIMKLTVHVDQVRLQQVLTDFLPNYIVHYSPSPDGWVEIQLRPSMKPLSAGVTIVHVELRYIL